MFGVIETFRSAFMELARQSRLKPEEASVKFLGYCQQNPLLSEGLQNLYRECQAEIDCISASELR